VALQRDCLLGVLGTAVSATFTVTWTRSASTWASGQQVFLTTGAGAVVQSQPVSASATSASFSVTLPSGSYRAFVRASYASWTADSTPTGSVSC
jgi:hypothetical protein